jgi:hypothetical protein
MQLNMQSTTYGSLAYLDQQVWTPIGSGDKPDFPAMSEYCLDSKAHYQHYRLDVSNDLDNYLSLGELELFKLPKFTRAGKFSQHEILEHNALHFPLQSHIQLGFKAAVILLEQPGGFLSDLEGVHLTAFAL